MCAAPPDSASSMLKPGIERALPRPCAPSSPMTSRGPGEALDEARRDDADDALVPALAREHEHG